MSTISGNELPEEEKDPHRPRGQEELLLKMYDTLRKEIEGFIKETGVLATFALLATGTVWAWAIDHLGTIQPRLLLFFPAFLALLFWLRAYGVRAMIHKASDHLAKLEMHFGLDAKLGWDSGWHAKRERFGWKSDRDYLLGAWHHLFWIFIVAANITIACVLFFA
jgi:hypothetical protein